jgi:starch synthase
VYGPRPVDILLVTSEIAPYSHATIAAQSAASLAKSLRGLHHKVTVVSPLYAGIDPAARSLARRLSKVDVTVAGQRYQCEVYDGRTTGGVDLVFIGEVKLFGARSTTLNGASPSELVDSVVFARAVAEVVRTRDPQPDLIHAFGAAAAAVLAGVKAHFPAARTFLSIHDAGADAALTGVTSADLGVPPQLWTELGLQSASTLLSIGAAAADRVLVPSASMADKVQAPPHKLLVLADGVDAALWNPLTDAALSSRFDPMDLSGKRHCKAQLQRQLQLPERADVPLIVALAPLAAAERLASIMSDALSNDVQIAIVVRPGVEGLDALSKVQERFPDRMAVARDVTDALIHQALGAADLVLLPPVAEPREPFHRIAQRYGALPIVAGVGSVQDTVVDCDPALVTGNGFLFEDEGALLATIQRAIAAYARSQAFEKLRVRVMRLDSSWERSARLYEQAAQSRKLTN